MNLTGLPRHTGEQRQIGGEGQRVDRSGDRVFEEQHDLVPGSSSWPSSYRASSCEKTSAVPDDNGTFLPTMLDEAVTSLPGGES